MDPSILDPKRAYSFNNVKKNSMIPHAANVEVDESLH
jgi:hypothetical protein